MKTYKLLPNVNYFMDKTLQPTSVLLVEEHKHIPFDPDNTDYQAYLKWVAEGNEPLPADE